MKKFTGFEKYKIRRLEKCLEVIFLTCYIICIKVIIIVKFLRIIKLKSEILKQPLKLDWTLRFNTNNYFLIYFNILEMNFLL